DRQASSASRLPFEARPSSDLARDRSSGSAMTADQASKPSPTATRSKGGGRRRQSGKGGGTAGSVMASLSCSSRSSAKVAEGSSQWVRSGFGRGVHDRMM